MNKIEDIITEAESTTEEPKLILDPTNPMQSARDLLGTECVDGHGRQTLHRHRESFYDWTGSFYREFSDEGVRSRVWKTLYGAMKYTEEKLVPFKPSMSNVSSVIDALRAASLVPSHLDLPIWLNGQGDRPAPNELFACANGLLHVPSGKLLPPTPEFFGLCASTVAYKPKAAKPKLWLATLDQWFGGDAEAIGTLQEEMGYTLTPDTSQQKLFLFQGPPRCGKGTIARVWTSLLGKDSVAGPSLASMAREFGLQPLIGKPLAIVSDFRIGPKTDEAALSERLLSISGEDHLTVPRKFKDAWHGRLGLRLCLISNDLPAFKDASGALPSRFIILTFKQSWLGQEDPALTNKLNAELPGILNWAIEGYRRLKERGHFVQPASSQDAVEELAALASPIRAFVRDVCVMAPARRIRVDLLFERWKEWCAREGRNFAGTKQKFGRDLKAALPYVRIVKRREGEIRWHEYEGLSLAEPEETTF